MSSSNGFETTDINGSAFITMHPEKASALKSAPVKNEKEPETSEPESAANLGGAPSVPSSFLLWVDVNMSVKLKTNEHPDGEWITLWCDDEPTPCRWEGRYYFWTWFKSNWNKNKRLLSSKGIPIPEANHHSFAPCDIAIPYEYVIQDPYHK